MSDYPYKAEVLVDRSGSAPLRCGDIVVVGGPLHDCGSVWVYDSDYPEKPWVADAHILRRVDDAVDEHIPHAGETYSPIREIFCGSGWKGGGK